LSLVERIREIRGDAHVGAGDAAGNDPDRRLVDQVALLRDVRLLAERATAQADRQQTEYHKDASQNPGSEWFSVFYLT
jgi:hypothetical protein